MNVAYPLAPRRMTVEEFLGWDGGGLVGKLELVEGEVRVLSPASGTHAIIQANLAYLIGHHLRTHRPSCRVSTGAPIAPRIHANDNVRAPDLAVTCLPPSRSKLFPDPVMIAEVLSPSNQRETWESIRAIASVPSLIEILVVDSEHVHVVVLRREADGGWPVSGQVEATNGSVHLSSIGLELPLDEIYRGTHLA